MTTDYNSILKAIDAIDPIEYGRSRNFVDGAVTMLSPYISRGVISTRQIMMSVIQRGYRLHEVESFLKELCWRDYFQRVAQSKDINAAIRNEQQSVAHHQIPSAIVNATTGITGIDTAIKALYETGYIHNHCRMYTAFLTCNLAQSHWHLPAQWMYYHLLDGDWASNACSWQWVAGANSSKKYYANQENINKYTRTDQHGTFLDQPYETLMQSDIPTALEAIEDLYLSTSLPPSQDNLPKNNLPVFIYNYYNLDPQWHRDETGNRILLLEPDVFAQYPVSEKCISFMIELAANIPDVRIFTGSFNELKQRFPDSKFYFKEHPFNSNYTGIAESRDWMTPEVTGYFPSFFSFWKKAEKELLPLFSSN